MIRSISSTIYRAERLQIDLSVNLVTNDGEVDYCRLTKGSKAEYLNITPNSSLRWKRIRGKDEPYIQREPGEWNPKEQLFVVPHDFYTVRSDLRRFYQAFQNPEIFQYDEESGYPVAIQKPIRVVSALRFDQFIRWEPTLIVDRRRSNVYYPGVACAINVATQEVPLDINEFEMLYDTMERFDFYKEGMSLLTNFLLVQNNMKYYKQLSDDAKPTIKNHTSMGIFEQAEKRKELDSTKNREVSMMPIIKQPNTLDEL